MKQPWYGPCSQGIIGGAVLPSLVGAAVHDGCCLMGKPASWPEHAWLRVLRVLRPASDTPDRSPVQEPTHSANEYGECSMATRPTSLLGHVDDGSAQVAPMLQQNLQRKLWLVEAPSSLAMLLKSS